jgi:hypothetical protein
MKNTVNTFALLILLMSYVSCSSTSPNQLIQPAEFSNANRNKTEEVTFRKIIYTASMEVVVEEPEMVAEQLTTMVTSQSGYLQSRQNLTLNFRIKADQIPLVFDQMEQAGRIKSKYLGSTDITEEYYDNDSRLDNLKTVKKRYLELLKQAASVQDILSVERELERVNLEIDLLQGRMNRIKNQVELASLTVTLKEKKKAGVLGVIGKGIYNGVKWLFVRN